MNRKQRLVNLIRLILKGTAGDDLEAVAQDQVMNEFHAVLQAHKVKSTPAVMADPFISDLLADAGNAEHQGARALLNKLVERPLAEWENS